MWLCQKIKLKIFPIFKICISNQCWNKIFLCCIFYFHQVPASPESIDADSLVAHNEQHSQSLHWLQPHVQSYGQFKYQPQTERQKTPGSGCGKPTDTRSGNVGWESACPTATRCRPLARTPAPSQCRKSAANTESTAAVAAGGDVRVDSNAAPNCSVLRLLWEGILLRS